MKTKFVALTLTLVAFAGFLAACNTATNTNTNTRANTTNLGTNNANTGAIVVNSNTNANRWSNVNANLSRADYDRDRAEYERDKGGSVIGSGPNDSWLWFKTRAAMLTTADLRESTIDVDVENAAVTLRGSVASAAQKTKAEQVAKGIDGVAKVTNNLTVAAGDSITNTGGNSSNANTNRRP